MLQWTSAAEYTYGLRSKTVAPWWKISVATLTALVIGACSHLGAVKSTEKAAATAQKGYIGARNNVDARASDYASELKIAATMMPASPYQTVTKQLSGLIVDLLGPGKLSQADKESFVRGLLKNEPNAARLIGEQQKEVTDLRAQVVAKDTAVQIANARADQAAQAAGSVADEADGVIHKIIACVVIMAIVFALFIFFKLTATGAALLAKFP